LTRFSSTNILVSPLIGKIIQPIAWIIRESNGNLTLSYIRLIISQVDYVKHSLKLMLKSPIASITFMGEFLSPQGSPWNALASGTLK
jgi:hypothetical protein